MKKIILIFLIFLLILGCVDKPKEIDEKDLNKIENSEKETDLNKIIENKKTLKIYPSEANLSTEEFSVFIHEPDCMEEKVVVKVDFEKCFFLR